MKAYYNDQVIANSDETIYIEGNYYFPKDSVKLDIFEDSDLHTECHWKGTASYYHIKNGPQNAAWYYHEPLPSAQQRTKKDITDYIAFYPQYVKVASD